MKTIDLKREKHSIEEILTMAKSDTVIIHSIDGPDFLLEEADEFDQEVARLGSSDKFMSLLEERSREEDDIPMNEVANNRGIKNL